MASQVACDSSRPECGARSEGGVAIGTEWGEPHLKRPFRTGTPTLGNAVNHEVHRVNGPLDQGRRYSVFRVGVFG
jgi:hypothetical protein